MTRSLRFRLILWMLALLVPASVAAGWLLVRVFGERLLRDIDVALQEEAVTAGELLEGPAGGDTMATLLAHVSGETDLGTGKRVAVYRRGVLIGEAPAGAAEFLTSHGPPNLRIAKYQTGAADDPLIVTVGVPAAAAAHAAQRLTLLLAAGIPCGVLLITAGLWIVLGRALRPLQDASRRMDAIGVTDLTTRVPVDHPDDEVGRMVRALNRMLDRLARAVGEMQRFTADAAHELRTPLAVLRTGIEVALAHERSASEYRAVLNEALEGTERLSHLAEDLLTLARLEALKAQEPETPVSINELLEDLAEAWRSRAVQRGVMLQQPCPAADLTVRGAPADLYRLFGNLIDNALRHTPRGGAVELAAEQAGDQVRCTVSDTGPGLSDADLSRVFDRFYRGRNQREPGTGLGLSIAQAIARAHDGDITLANGAQGGCVAVVSLPRETIQRDEGLRRQPVAG